MRTISWLAAPVLILLIPDGDAQQVQPAVSAETQTAGGLHAVTFQLPQGTIRANFPDDLAAGDTISGTVFSLPAGTTPAQKESNSGELSGYVVDVEQQKTPVSDKTLQWAVPPALGGGTAVVVLRNPSGDPVARSPIPVGVPAKGAEQDTFELPTTGTAGGFATARGPFDGDLRTTAVTVGGATAQVVAESPRKIVFRPPTSQRGPSKLEIRKGSLTASAPFRTIGVLLTATSTNLLKGQTATLTVTVEGLQDLTEPADLILLNRSPGVVNVQGGPEQHFVIQPQQVRPDGTYIQTRTLTGITAGGFNLMAIANRRPTLQFDLTRTVDRAVIDWQRSTGVPITPDARQSIGKSVMNTRNQLDDFLRAQEPFHGEPVSITDMLVRNYCFDLRDSRRAGVATSRGRTGELGFLPQQASPPAMAIDDNDVNRFGFGKFLAQLVNWLSPNQPVGYLSVSSRPDQVAVSVDNHRGPDRTNRKFVVSVGTHLVLVAMPSGPCRRNIQVQAFQTGIVACP
jgi:hypothetical protein